MRVIAGRYLVERTLGEGGVGWVYDVVDRSNGARLALKQLRADASERAAALFHREYRTLAGLRHPCIVRVFDYGVDDGGPYFTMERLEGRDLRDRAPIPWTSACAYMRDLASILGLLHARRVLYRDLSPRNLIEHAGRLKLIDFGALADFGPVVDVAGTPAYVAPETIQRGWLDQRSDLFALGALGYWLITGTQAFPARSLNDLQRFWQREPPPASTLVHTLGDATLEAPPQQLDELLSQLLRVHPQERIASTAELIDRLTVIAGLPPEAADDAVAGYMRSSAFVGRQEELSSVSEALNEASQGSGRVVLIQGDAGIGRSRLLSEIALSARVAGALTWTHDSMSGRRAYALAESLLAQLQRALPQESARILAPHAQALALLQRGRVTDPSFGEARARLQNALLQVFSAVARAHFVVLLIDDLQTVDEESRGLLNALAHRAPELKLCLIASLADEVPRDSSAAISSLRGVATSLRLAPLTAAQTRELLCSVFGDVPYLDRLSERLHRISEGNPGHSLELAERLVDAGTAYYLEGGWVLPMELSTADLPLNRQAGLLARLSDLPAATRAVAHVMSVPHLAAWSVQQVAWAGDMPRADAAEHIAVLSRERVLEQHGEGYVFAHETLRATLHDELSAARRREIHARLGLALLGVVAAQDLAFSLCACVHLIRAGELARAYPLLKSVLEQCVTGDPARIGSYASSFEEVLRVLREARQDDFAVCGPLGMLAVSGYFADRRYALRYGAEAIAALQHVLRATLAERLRPFLGRRLGFFVALGFAAVGCILRRDRCLSVVHTVRLLLLAASTLAGTAAICMDPARAGRYARCLAPLTALGSNHAASFVHAFSAQMEHQGRDHPSHCVRAYRALLERLDDPRPIQELDQQVRSSYYAGILLTMGVFLVRRDDHDGLRVADQLEQFSPLYAMSADHLRANYYAAQGDLRRAGLARRRMEVHAVQLGSAWQVETWAPVDTINIAWRLSDPAEMKRAIQELSTLGAEVPSLGHQELYARVSYLVLREQYTEAIELYATANDPPYAMNGWMRTQGTIARAHNALGQHAMARDICLRALAEADLAERQYVVMNLGVEVELALAEAGLGRCDVAREQLEKLIAQHAPHASAVTLGALHEARCRVAVVESDCAAAHEHLQRAQALYRDLGVASLINRARVLERELHELEAAHTTPPDADSVQRFTALLRRHAAHGGGANHCVQAVLELYDVDEAMMVFTDEVVQASTPSGSSPPQHELVTWARLKLESADDQAATLVTTDIPAGDGSRKWLGDTLYRAIPLWSNFRAAREPLAILVLGSKRGLPDTFEPLTLKAIAQQLMASRQPRA